MRGQLIILNLREKLKRKIKFIKGSNQNQKNEEYIWKKITNHNYGFNDEIENKSKFDKKNQQKLKIKIMRTKVEISVNNMKFWIESVNFEGWREIRKRRKKMSLATQHRINNDTRRLTHKKMT
jgi:hypothetical protein